MRTITLLICSISICQAQQDPRRLQPVPVSAKRVALAMGNNNYQATALKNAVNDATAVAARLSGLGFNAQLTTNSSYRETEEAVDKFILSLRPGDVALFYYSGHGVQVDGENYLIPIDFAGRDEREVRFKAYAAGRVHDRMAGTGARLSIVILDACRDNSFRGARSGSGGLAQMNPAAGSYIVYATAANATASDNANEKNGLFTKYLLETLDVPGLSLAQLFEKVSERVYAASNKKQLPWTSSSVIGEFVFHDAMLAEKRLSTALAELAQLQ